MRVSAFARVCAVLGGTILSTAAYAGSDKTIQYSQLDGKTKLPDGDIIQVIDIPDGAPDGVIEITLKLQVDWWKGIQSDSIVLCQAQGSQTTSTAQIKYNDFSSRGLQLWKAKRFGVHYNMYDISGVQQNMKAGHSYAFIWSRD